MSMVIAHHGLRMIRGRLSLWRQDWPWIMAVGFIAALALAPLVTIATLAVVAPSDTWPHLAKTVLAKALWDTAIFLLGVGFISVSIGVSTAWLVTAYRFPGRRLLTWALFLPFAVPTYIVAYAYGEILDYFGPMQTLLRGLFGFRSRTDYWFPDIRSMGGAVLLMGFVLYPYVYLAARAMFSMQAACVLDVAHTLGSSRRRSFFLVALPLARPAIATGTALALLEAMNDIGAMEYLGVHTLTFSIYSTWLNRGSLPGAAQIACIALGLVLFLAGLEQWARRYQRYAPQAQRERPLSPMLLNGKGAVIAFATCIIPIFIGFAAPAIFLIKTAVERTVRNGLLSDFWLALGHTILLAAIAAAIATTCGLVLAYGARIAHAAIVRPLVRLAGLGYAVPGTVFALGMLAPLAAFDNSLDAIMKSYFGLATGLALSASGCALMLAYVARYLAVASGTLRAGFAKVSPHLDMAARNLGRDRLAVMYEIHLPLIRPTAIAAFILVFVDVMKELPATLLLRPFNFETLATLIYGHASRGQFEDGSLAAITIVAMGLVPVIFLSRMRWSEDATLDDRMKRS